ncbi:ATP-dependent protease ATP-binding subunit clpL [Lactococcus lactis subsp. lactis]|jgi:ATP-dependent Clp protease ATP-binding subunit ClpL|uniref:ATP-dependent protease ATP-binding subunit clpL n=2 Tax=Lactococcus lactis subsp. lactis TaxID=1360 RepID=A0A0V8E2X1_LACLL|nr:ATP-dependent protease ClpL [Lactococcus lactis]MDN6164131.1 ATP-dependent Clp protease ATP-binding subunit [Tetragenococcus halophilus]MDN6244467.1 ATP-dependent Clp protease ATP-binding subunit [Tetragenococcus koreensis]MRM56720.1 AAA domain-containing protein [Lactococcus cremoris]AEK97266.1 ATP-dependent Clp protease, ATP-binding subunit ClpL [Lactococcus lactis subsp. lactis bv. diacetylactis]AZZ79490.1 ATP-binding subunit of Clp protease [Lactococcus lactis subsp. lactis]
MANFYGNDPFFNNDRDDVFNQLFRRMDNQNSERARYLVNGQSLTPDEFAQYRATGKLPQNNKTIEVSKDGKQAVKKGGILEKLGTNLTEQARDGLLDPVIGREKEIQETAEILSRRTKNNAILVGDAGVGKTAVVEGLAQAIVAGKVPETIQDKEIYSIDLSSLEAGTQYRGSFEENIKQLVEEVKAAGNIILFFDEIHQILGTGATGGEDGGKGLADIIKPALSRGELSVIGATTQDEYRNTILKNAALARRFNDVVINEPTAADTLRILQGVKELYEKHHHVVLPDDVLKAAVDYSIQYIPQRTLPDKAIDLIDMTAAHLAAKNSQTDVETLDQRLKKLEAAKEAAIKAEDFTKAADIKKSIEETEQKIKETDQKEKITATIDDVAQSVERLTGIPVSDMGANDIERLKNLDKRLKSKVIGQDEAVEMVAKAIRRNRAGFSEGDQPIGSFLFVGPTGVGKTELAKQLALDMFGNENAIIRLDMSEYADRTAVSKLIGTSAGYVGYEDNANTLTERVRRNPYSIVLLDEIEKADPQVLTLLLQVMDDGRLTDGQGNVINFKNTIIIATSNAGFGNEALSGDKQRDQSLMDKLAPFFRPEFLNRFNGIVEFSHLTKQDLSQIVDLMLADVQKTLAKKSIKLEVTKAAKDWLMEQGYDEAMGARPLRRVIEQQIRDKVTDFYLDHLDVKNLKADLVDAEIVISAA